MRIEFQSDAHRIRKRCASNFETTPIEQTEEQGIPPVKPRIYGVTKPSRPYRKGEGALFTSYTHGFAIRLLKVRPKDKVVVESCLGCFQFPKRASARFTAASSVEWKQLTFGARRSASKHSSLSDIHPQRLEKSTVRLPVFHKSHTTLYEKAHEPFSKTMRAFLKSLAPCGKSLGCFPKKSYERFSKVS